MRLHFGLCLGLIALLTIAALAPALAGPFLWDDESLILENRSVHELTQFRNWFRASLFSEHAQLFAAPSAIQYWRPLPIATFALDWWIGKGSPILFHATNLVLYAGMVVAVGWTVLRYTANAPATLIAVLLFALHPTHVESAGWISGRMDLLVLTAILLSMGALARRIRGRSEYIWLELAFAALAYLSKETASLLPVFALVEAAVARNVRHLSRATVCRLMRDILPQTALAGAYLLWRWFGLPPAMGAGASPELSVRPLIFLETVGRAVSLTIFPFPQRAQQGLFSLDAAGTIRTEAAFVWIGEASLLGLVLLGLLLRRNPKGLLALIWIIASFLPTSNLFSTGLLGCFVFERYLLLPHFGCAWLTAQLIGGTCGAISQRSQPYRYGAAGLALIAVPLLGYRAQIRAEDYANAERFWGHELAHNSLSSLAPAQLGTLASTPRERLKWMDLCAENATRRRQIDDADRCLLVAVETVIHALPDSRTRELGELARAMTAILTDEAQPDPPSHASIEGVKLAFPALKSRRASIVASRPGRIESDLALIYSRLGEHASSQRLAEAALSRCSQCRWNLPLAGVFAAAGQFDRAQAVLAAFPFGTPDLDRANRQVQEARTQFQGSQGLEGPPRLHALAQSFLAIGRFGLALQVLQHEEHAISESRDIALDYALIAARAGRFDIARRVLGKHAAPEVVDRIIAEWQREQPSLE